MAYSSPINSSSSTNSSSPISSCIQCKQSFSEPLMNSWKSRTGGYAQLCGSCHSLYEAGQFCEAFHGHEHGWRDCNSCRKLFHCGCIVSLSNYSLDDFGGITCVDCIKATAMHHTTSRSNTQDMEMQSSMVPQVVQLVPLFEKIMTKSDAKLRSGRIVIPKKHATAYFPQVSEGQVVPLHVLDLDGNEWLLYYRFWVQERYAIYVLQGMKDFMKLKSLQAGDTVAFYRREADEKLILELKKTSTGTSSHHA